MRKRSDDDFSDVITDLIFDNPDIVAVPRKFTHSTGVYHNPKARDGFQFAVAFETTDKVNGTWVETFGVKKDGTKMQLQGRWGLHNDDIIIQASEMVNHHLRSV